MACHSSGSVVLQEEGTRGWGRVGRLCPERTNATVPTASTIWLFVEVVLVFLAD